MTILAAIDIGTNTFRLLIASVNTGRSADKILFREIHSGRTITRLGEGLAETGILKKEAMERGVAALRQFGSLVNEYKAEKVLAVATSALRNARNSNEFIETVKESSGIEIEVISGEKEAELTSLGIMLDIDALSTLMVDIGGGSTELIFKNSDVPSSVLTLELGVVYLADKYMKSDPPSATDLNRLEDHIMKTLEPVKNFLPRQIPGNTLLTGTAGTITALAAALQRLERYDHNKVHKFRMNVADIKDIYSRMTKMTTAERSALLPFEPSRLDIIVPGTLILLKLMQKTGFSDITVSNYGLREGILVELYKRIK